MSGISPEILLATNADTETRPLWSIMNRDLPPKEPPIDIPTLRTKFSSWCANVAERLPNDIVDEFWDAFISSMFKAGSLMVAGGWALDAQQEGVSGRRSASSLLSIEVGNVMLIVAMRPFVPLFFRSEVKKAGTVNWYTKVLLIVVFLGWKLRAYCPGTCYDH
jgi:hypothetical protein